MSKLDKNYDAYKYNKLIENSNFNMTMFIGMMFAIILSVVDYNYFKIIFDNYDVYQAFVYLSLIWCTWFLIRKIYLEHKARKL